MSQPGPMDVLPNGTEFRAGAPNTPSGRTRAARDEAMLVAACEEHGAARGSISKLRVLKMVGRRSLPALVEATVIPSILFYVFLVSVGPFAAMCATLAWSYGSVLRRMVSGQRIPGVLQLSVAGLTVRTIVGLVSGTFMYFLQPVAATLALALVFLGSLRFGQPMIARMASDFCPLESDISGRPAVIRLFSGLTLMWAGVHLLSAGTTFAMLVSLPTTTFVALKFFVSLAITISAVLLTVSWAMRTARSENLVFAAVRRHPSEP
ncbi:MAG: putative rane protein [Actinomycetia bacterium]|jgi:intracellular septation protein A|nr:putative rane protein [Actinomycetes bacterium]